MAEPDLARTIIFDLVQLEKLGADLERRFRVNPTTRVADILVDIPPEDHCLYTPQLTKLLDDLRVNQAGAAVTHRSGDLHQTLDEGESLSRSLMATAMIDAADVGCATDVTTGFQFDHKPIERIDQFRIIRELGSGAFGVVYLAEDESLQRKVAIKVPRVSDPARSASYINEARKAAAIDTNGVVPIFHVGTMENGVPFVVQKLIDGPSLRVLLNRYGGLPPAHAITLMRDISIALGVAHRQGIYHRDLKPDNILIDSRGVPWIADFGLAITQSEQAQRRGEIAGTLLYMSPEQILGRAEWTDGRSDIWAMGITMYELLVGKPPFNGKSRKSLTEQICNHEPPWLREASEALAVVDAIFAKCCAKQPTDRYATIEAFADDLETLLGSELSTLPIDGNELTFERPISQYSSDESGQRRTRANGSSATKPANRKRSSMIAIAVACAALIGMKQWFTRQGLDPALATLPAMETSMSASLDASLLPNADAFSLPSGVEVANSELEIPNDAPGEINTAAMASNPPPEPIRENVMGIDEANGTESLPFVVSIDGAGSHRSLGSAIAACSSGAFVHLRPGTYDEAVRITIPMTIIGQGTDASKCVISSAIAPPLTVDFDSEIDGDSVRFVNIGFTGNAIQSGKEFNCVELAGGALQLEQCHIRSSTFNAVKVRQAASLVVKDCKFFESSAFAVSGRDHAKIEVSGCEFFYSGVQSVGGFARVLGSKFRGLEGVYIESSGDIASAVTDCDFIGNVGYGVLATENARVELVNNRFKKCNLGIQVYDGDVVVQRCSLEECVTAAIDQSGGKVVVGDGTTIFRSTGFGYRVNRGIGEITDADFSDIKQSGIIAMKGDVDLTIQSTTFSGCGTAAIALQSGTLRLTGGTIESSGDTGIFVGELFRGGTISGTSFRENVNAAIIAQAGSLQVSDVEISGSVVGMLLRSDLESTVEMDLQQPTFEDIEDVWIDLEGDVKLRLLAKDFVGVPGKTVYRSLGPHATVEVK